MKDLFGRVVLVMRHRNGKDVRVICGSNMVVNNTRNQMRNLFAGDGTISDRKISKMGFDTGSSPESKSDVALAGGTNSVIKDIDPDDITYGTDYDGRSTVTFKATLDFEDGNGLIMREIGLLFDNVVPNLAARRRYSTMTKTADWSWTVEWTLGWC